jgi:chemotaxis protein CheC
MKQSKNDIKLTKGDIDAIKEILSIGAANAATGLSEMTHSRVKINYPYIFNYYKLKEIPSLIGKPQDMMANIHMEIKGKIGKKIEPIGNFFLLFKLKEAIEFVNILRKQNIKELDDYGKDILKETANTIAGISFESISSFLEFKILESLPDISVDLLNSTIDPILSSIANEGDKTLVFISNFFVNDTKIKSHFSIVFHPRLYLLLIKKLRPEYKK